MVKSKETVVWISTDELLSRFHPSNPREHNTDEGGDVEAIRQSLLEIGWATTLTVQEDGYLLSGHGRCMAADFLRQQNEEWFSHSWDKWLSRSPDRKQIAQLHHPRFNAEYWQKCPCITVKLDDATQKASLIRLNNAVRDGKDDPKRLATLLSQLPKEQYDQAGWDKKTADAFISAFAVKKQELPPEEEPHLFGGKQYFERPDATDYSGDGDEALSQDDIDEGEISSSWEGAEDEWEEGEDEDGDRPTSNYDSASTPEIAEVDTDIEEFKPDIFDHTKEYGETRAVLYLSKEELLEFKKLVSDAATILDVDTVSNIAKIWRSQAVMAVLREFTTGKLPPQSDSPPPEQ